MKELSVNYKKNIELSNSGKEWNLFLVIFRYDIPQY